MKPNPGERRIALPRLGGSSAAEMDQEIDAHLQMRIDDLVRGGMDREAARLEAERRFGDFKNARHDLHAAARRREAAVRHRDLFGALRADVHFAFRQLRRNAAHSLLAMGTLALGIGLTTAMFTLVHGVLLTPLPFPHAEELVYVQGRDSLRNNVEVVSNDDWLDWKERTRSFASFAGYAIPSRQSIAVGDSAVRATITSVSADFFQVVRPRFIVGRPFSPDEVAAGSAGLVVGERFWRDAMAADSTLRTKVGTRGIPVVGVVAAGSTYPEGVDLWQPMTIARFGGGVTRNNINMFGLARLKAGVTAAQATADLDRVARDIRARDSGGLYDFGGSATSLQSYVVGDSAASSLRLLMECVLLVLLIVCANLAIATLARGASRQQEMAVRASLGAGRGRLIVQLLVEHVILALLAGAAGVAIAWGSVRLIVTAWSDSIPRAADIHLDVTVLAFAIGTSFVVGLTAGIVPALQGSRVSLQDVMKAGGRGSVGGGHRTATALVVAEFALAVTLLTGAGLLIRSFQRLVGRDVGFDRAVATMEVGLTAPQYRTDSLLRLATWDRLIAAYRAIPSVQAVGVANWVPLHVAGMSFVDFEGRSEANGGAGYRVVSEDYFSAIGLRMLNGRSLLPQDAAGAERAVVINEAMARKYWPAGNPIGQRIRARGMESGFKGEPAPWLTIVGVVSNLRQHGVEGAFLPEMYVSFRQVPQWRTTVLTAVVRSKVAASQLLPQLRERTRGVDPHLTGDASSLTIRLAEMLAPRRITMSLLTGFAGLAMLLAALGIYAVLSYSVAGRAREFALRTALGAQRSDLLIMVLRGGMKTVALGVAIGIAAALSLSKLMTSMLVDVSAIDPATFAAAALVLVLAALAAIVLPAIRATRMSPMLVIKGD